MENKIRELCEKIVNLKGGEFFRTKEHCKGIVCCECPFVHASCEYITKESFETYQTIARKWLEDNKTTEQRKFKVGDKVVKSDGEIWEGDFKYRTIIKVLEDGYYLSITENNGMSSVKWFEKDLELYQKEQPKTYNIIEALKLPVGTRFKITFSDGSEETGYLGKYGLKEGENNVLLIGSLKEEARVTGHLVNATYTVIEEQKPISFFEAVEQADKKRFRIEHELYKKCEYLTLERHMFNLYEDFYSIDMRNIMLNAKCYLED